MLFETYVINLKRDIQKYYNLKKIMNKKHINLIRFDAIYGKKITNFKPYDKYISSYCKYFCPRGLVGCGLSHMMLLDNVYKKYCKYKNTEFTLILEDDVTPLFDDIQTINNIITNDYPKDCDILLLFCQGSCGYDDNNNNKTIKKESNIIGSTAAYIIKNASIPKFLENSLKFHIDVQWYENKNIISYVYNKKIFSVDNSTSYNANGQLNNFFTNTLDKLIKLDNTSVSQSLNYKFFRFPIIGLEISCFDVIVFLIIIIIIFIILKYYDCYKLNI